MNKINKYKINDKKLAIESEDIIVALFCDEKNYLKFDKFKGKLVVNLPDELKHWNENNILTFYYYEDCIQHIDEYNLTGYESTWLVS